VQLVIKLASVKSCEQFVFNDFLNSDRDVEERTAPGKLFQTEVAPPMVARQVREITKTVDDEERSR